MALTINGKQTEGPDDARVSLLDFLREQVGLTGTKVGCNQGGCGACTVLVDGQRVLSCLMLAVQAEGCSVTTIEGLGSAGELHPLQQAFIDHDALQCGYCTPGQICSARALLDELKAGVPSYVSADLEPAPRITREEIQERMSGNLCRCGAHNGIIDAILQVASA